MKIRFEQTGPFEACYAAEAWCEDRGISVGAMQSHSPRGLSREPCAIAKWRNLNDHERRSLDGTMTGDMRHGPVTIELRGDKSDYPIVEFQDEWDDERF